MSTKIKVKVQKKVAKAKQKVAKAKQKVGRKCAAIGVALCLAFVLVGCQNPAQRAQTAETSINVFGGSVSFGSEFVSLAQSNETRGDDAGQTASPTTDIRPTTDVNTTGGRTAGVLETAANAAVSALVGTKGENAASTSSKSACTDGSCTDCTDGSCDP